jgi:hypothetical protein
LDLRFAVIKNNQDEDVIVIDERKIVAIIKGDSIKINEKDPKLTPDTTKFQSVTLTKEQIFILAEQLKDYND